MSESMITAENIENLSPAKKRLMQQWLRGDIDAAGDITIPRRDDAEVIPLSFSQQRLWFLDQLVGGNPFYNVPAAIPLPVHTSPGILKRSVNEIVKRHEVLRTNFVVVDGKPAQVIVPVLNIQMNTISLRHHGSDGQRAEAQILATEEARKPFDLENDPLLRTTLLDLGEQGYLFLLTIHHIVSDGWSIGVLFKELSALYTAFANGRTCTLPELSIQYADFALWQRNWLQGEVLQEQLDYWKLQLDSLPLFQLHCDRPRPAIMSYQGAHHNFALPIQLSNDLKGLSEAEETTLFMTVFAAFVILMQRYTGASDIVIGSPIANRNRTEIEPLIGFFVNSLVLRIRLDNSASYREVLQHVKDVTLGAYAHQDIPFEMLVEQLQPERDLSRNPLFQITFQIANTPMTQQIDGNNKGNTSIAAAEQGTSIFDLAINMWQGTEELHGQVEYSTDLFDGSTIERMMGHFIKLLQGIVENPDAAVSELPMLTPYENRQLLIEWNNTSCEYASNLCVHQLFEAQVERAPDSVAVLYDRKSIEYEGLNQRANKLAHYLMSNGIGVESIVGVCLDKSIDLVVALLGVLKAGAAYLPLDPNYPVERLAYMVEDAGCPVLITQEYLLEKFETRTVQDIIVHCLDRDRAIIDKEKTDNPAPCVKLDNLAYIIYTSGSLGKPKGVMVTHASLSNHMLWMQSRFPLSKEDRVLQRTPFSFDASVWEFFAPLVAGASLIMKKTSATLDVGNLIAEIDENKATILQLVPSLLALLLNESGFTNNISLRRVFSGGERLPVDLVDRFLRLMDIDLINLYGPTEATIDATYFVCEHGTAYETVPIGRPIANTKLYILDECLQPVPVNVPGQLYIGGEGLARSYYNQAELTREKFIPNPFVEENNARLYKTGDLVRIRADGNIEFLGRIDHQIKLRGFRIELGEIETVLRSCPGVGDAAVVLKEDKENGKRIVAYIATNMNITVSVSELRQQLKSKLPDYMVPAVFTMMSELPKMPNGKVDYNNLPAPDSIRPDLDQPFQPPRSEAEKTLARIWCDVLGIDGVGVNDNFFELGGDSILSIQIISRAKQSGINISAQQIFQHQTIAELAISTSRTSIVEAEQGVVTGDVPLTPVQQWFFEQNRTESHHFNQSVSIGMPLGIDINIIQKVLQHLLAHHDALRLRFECYNGKWQQNNNALDEAIPFQQFDLSALTESEADEQIVSAATSLQASLNLSDGPILRMALFNMSKASRLVMIIHHLAIDGVSWRILLEDFQTAYQQLSSGRQVGLVPKTTSFKRWAERLNQYAKQQDSNIELPYWLGMPPQFPTLPVDFIRGRNTVGAAQSIVSVLSEEETLALLHEVPRVFRSQINDVLLTALALTLQQWMRSRLVLIDLEGHGREDLFPEIDVSRTIGWFTSIYPVWIELDTHLSATEALKSVKEQLHAIPNRGIGYGVLRYLNPDPEVKAALHSLPQAEVSFNYMGQIGERQGQDKESTQASGSLGPWYSLKGEREYKIEINCAIERNILSVVWAYSSNLHHQKTIENLAEYYLDSLRSIVAHCKTPNSMEYTASDFSESGLNQDELNRLMSSLGQSSENE